METVVVILAMLACVVAAVLTVPAGFGLATMVTPVFLVWLERWKSDDIQRGIVIGLVITGILYVREALEALSLT